MYKSLRNIINEVMTITSNNCFCNLAHVLDLLYLAVFYLHAYYLPDLPIIVGPSSPIGIQPP